MKNIHVLPTDKPSRLFEILLFNFVFDNQNKYSEEYKKLHSYKNKNTYITSDEEIKEGDWILDIELNRIEQCLYSGTFRNWKKIILTTDQDLIKDGVQAIDDEFLEWFVKNPSCEEVEVVKEVNKSLSVKEPYYIYKIIIPKEEVLSQSSIDGEVIWGELKQETLEEAVKKIFRKQ